MDKGCSRSKYAGVRPTSHHAWMVGMSHGQARYGHLYREMTPPSAKHLLSRPNWAGATRGLSDEHPLSFVDVFAPSGREDVPEGAVAWPPLDRPVLGTNFLRANAVARMPETTATW